MNLNPNFEAALTKAASSGLDAYLRNYKRQNILVQVEIHQSESVGLGFAHIRVKHFSI